MKLRKKAFPILLPTNRLQPLGVLFDSDFLGNGLAANGYVKTGATAVWTANADGTIVTTSTTNASTDYISYTTYGTTVLEDLVINAEFTIDAINADSTAIVFGIDGSDQGVSSCMHCELLINTGATNGTLKLNQGTFTTIATGATKLRCVAGDRVRVYITRNKITLTFTAENLMNGSTESVSATYTTSQIVSVNGYFAIWNRGGNYTINKHTANSSQIKNVKTIVRGDSISAGFIPSVLNNRYYTQLGMPYYSSCNLSAGSIDTTGILTSIQETLLLTGTYFIAMFGGNDIAHSIPLATMKSNYDSIVNQIKSNGFTVIHCLPTPRNTIDVTPLKDYINLTYSSDIIVDTYTPLWSGGGTTLNAAYNSGDGVHPNNAGHALIASTILAAAPQIV